MEGKGEDGGIKVTNIVAANRIKHSKVGTGRLVRGGELGQLVPGLP